MSFVFKVHGIVTTEASVAKTPGLAVEVSVHPFSSEIGERVGLDETADLFDGARRCDELGACRRIDAVITWADRRRRADAHVHFLCAGIAKHADNLSACGSANDGIIDDDHALPM